MVNYKTKKNVARGNAQIEKSKKKSEEIICRSRKWRDFKKIIGEKWIT